MMFLRKIPLIMLLVLLTVSCSTDSPDTNEDVLVERLVVPPTKQIETEVLELINNHRLTLGLNPLGNLEIVKSIAYSHTDYMVDKNEVSHDNFYTRSTYLKENVGAKKVSENVAYGYSSAESVVRAWIKSDGHRANIEGDFSNFNISAEKNDEGKWFYTNIFIKK